MDFDTGSITIKKAVVRAKDNHWVEKGTKSTNSTRTTHAPDYILQMLDAEKARSTSERVVPLSSESMYKSLKRLLQKNGLPDIRFHDLRHPYVKHTTKKYNSEKQKTQATKMDLIAWVFRFYTFNYSKRSWIL